MNEYSILGLNCMTFSMNLIKAVIDIFIIILKCTAARVLITGGVLTN